MKKVLFAAALIGATAVSSIPAAAEVCGKRDTVLTRLSEKFGETRRSLGLGANNGVVEVFANDETGSWTITVTMPDGRMCLVASGQSYEDTIDSLDASDDA